MPIAIIIVLALVGAANIAGIGMFHYDYKHGRVAPEDRYKNRKAWWWLMTIAFFLVGFGYTFRSIIK